MIIGRKVHNLQVSIIISISLVGYIYWATINAIQIGLVDILSVAMLNSLLVFGFWFYLYKTKTVITISQLIAGAIIFRLVAVIGSPMLEDDYFRYLLDGCVFAEYGNPYGITPSSLFLKNSLSSSCQQLLNQVNNPTYATIYAPVYQYIFYFAYLISPANITVLQLICALFDIGVIVLLLKMAKPNFVLLYAWNPLVIKEAVFTAHPDVITVFLLLLSMYLVSRKSFMLSAISMALAFASKIFAIVLIPFLLIQIPRRYWLLFVVSLMALYFQFALAAQTDFTVLVQFAKQWEFNASLFYLFDYIFGSSISRYLLILLFAMSWLYLFFIFLKNKKRNGLFRADLIIALLLLISPVVNPWYLLWLLPFACIYPSSWAWVASVSFWFSYIIGLHLEDFTIGPYQQPLWGWLLVYVPVFIALAWSIKVFFTSRQQHVNQNFD